MEKWIKVEAIACVLALLYAVAKDIGMLIISRQNRPKLTPNKSTGKEMNWIPTVATGLLLFLSMAMYTGHWPSGSGKMNWIPLLLCTLLILCVIAIYKWSLNREEKPPEPSAPPSSAAKPGSYSSTIAPTLVKTPEAPPPPIPIIGLTVLKVVVEPFDTTIGRNYPRKLRLYFRNEGDPIHLRRSVWESEGIGIQKGKPFACYYQLEASPNKFDAESNERIIPPGQSGRLYVGLDSSVNETEIQRLKESRTLGLLRLHAIVDGMNVELRMRP